MTKERIKPENMRLQQLLDNESIADDVVSYFDRLTDHDAVRNAIKVRYGFGIKVSTDPNNADAAGIETYVKQDWTTQVDAGAIEAVSLGFGQKIVGALANLFSEPGQKFGIVPPDEGTDVKPAELLLAKHRKAGGFSSAITDADIRSIQVGSGAVFVNFFGGSLDYQTLVPSQVRVFHGDIIVEDGITRSANRNDLEDAYAVTIRLSQVEASTYIYLAIFSRSDEHPMGRWVEYEAESETFDIPDVGDKSIITEYEIGGERANPLSHYAAAHPEEPVPEFPIAVIKGVVDDANKVMPVSTSLYQDCIEYDLGGSHIQSAAQEGARGVDVLSINEQGKGQPLPRTLSGQTVTNPGQTLTHEEKGATESKAAYETQKMIMIDTAGGYSVPDFMATSEDHTVDASSGIALEVKARPLKKTRDRRVDRNENQVSKIYEIEKYLLDMFLEAGTEGLALLVSSVQSWDPGEIQLPENKKESAERIVSLMAAGLMDTIEGLRQTYKFPTDAEAIEFYQKMKERKGEYPPLVDDKPKTAGLQFRGQNTAANGGKNGNAN